MSGKVPPIITAAQAEKLYGGPDGRPTKREWYSWVEHRAIPDDCYFRSGRTLWFIRPRLEAWLGLSRNGDGEHQEQS